MAEPKRYFINNLKDYEGGDVSFHKNMQRKHINLLITTIFEKFQISFPNVDGGLYIGLGGVAYMLYHLSKLPSFVDCQKEYLHQALSYMKLPLQTAMQSQQMSHLVDKTGFLTGHVGIFAVASVILNKLGKTEESTQCLREFSAVSQILKNRDWHSNGGDELFVGRAGYLCCLSWLRRELLVQVLPDEEIFALLDTIIESGEAYSKSVNSPFPLLFHYYRTEYIGPAHGLSGILFVLLSFPTWLHSRPKAQSLILSCLDLLLQLQQPNGNFPTAMDEVSGGRAPEEELVHWCHGAPGVVYVLAKAYLLNKDEKYLQAALKCGEITWQKGLLKKGPGICHGIASSGYVFLLLYRLTRDLMHLHRAVQFMNFIYSPEFRRARQPDNPYSLFEGLAGTICYAADILHPEIGEFPFFSVF